MGLLTFKGGLHPYDGKELSKDKPITEYLPQGELVYPLSQHIGAPAVACVKKGDRVLVGQKIAEAGGFVSANIYSSVSGTVKKIEPRMTVSGNKVNSIIVENRHTYRQGWQDDHSRKSCVTEYRKSVSGNRRGRAEERSQAA